VGFLENDEVREIRLGPLSQPVSIQVERQGFGAKLPFRIAGKAVHLQDDIMIQKFPDMAVILGVQHRSELSIGHGQEYPFR